MPQAPALLLWLTLTAPSQTPDLHVVVGLDPQAGEMWSDVPGSSSESRVTVVGGSPGECADDALQRVRAALKNVRAHRVALRLLSIERDVPRALLKAADSAAQVYRLVAGRPARAQQPLLDAECPGLVASEMGGGLEDPAPGLRIVVEAACGCAPAAPGGVRRQFQVVGEGALEPSETRFGGRGVTQKWRLEDRRYLVSAYCRPCDKRDQAREEAPATAPSSGGGLSPVLIGGLAAAGAAGAVVVATKGSGSAEPPPVLESEYVLSGDQSPSTTFPLDDFLRLYVNGAVLGDFFGCRQTCVPGGPIRFRARSGDRLTVEAYDTGDLYILGALYLHKDGQSQGLFVPPVGACSVPRLPCPTPVGAPVLFFQQTFTLP